MSTCPICSNVTFQARRGRAREECTKCKSVGRARLVYATMQRLDLLKRGASVIHFAPEASLNMALYEVYGDTYWISNINMRDLARYKGASIVVDLCAPSDEVQQHRFDVILHSHILEHLPCNWALAFIQLHSLLEKGGVHLFSIPMFNGRSREDLRPDMSEGERVQRFGQMDHMRSFGRDDFAGELEKLAQITGSKPIIAADLFSDKERAELRLNGDVFALIDQR